MVTGILADFNAEGHVSILVGILIGLLATSTTAWAYPPEYGPFEPGHEPKRFKLHDCRQVEPAVKGPDGEPTQYTFGIESTSRLQPILRLTWRDESCQLAILSAAGRTLAGPASVSEQFAYLDVQHADLNRDGREDFVVQIASMGCGLGAEYYNVALAISDGSTYRISSIVTTMPGPEDYVDVDGDGKCEIIQSAFIHNDEQDEPDRKPHNYRVYNLLEVRGGTLQISKKDWRFPCWIWYTFKPNHKPAQRLAVELKKRLWREQGKIFWKPPDRAPSSESARSASQPARTAR